LKIIGKKSIKNELISATRTSQSNPKQLLIGTKNTFKIAFLNNLKNTSPEYWILAAVQDI
jgi:hypothetical protein